ncbi:hypothetical protein RMSM_03820 [Rhodopirellula maiorica SM1]|uniref:Uncharacterized protein n=1 Tax=Rhodopirellula maiorica SM1 TaxID=1265738 RepID=M5RJ70_9BACT|nr:hypothetical protein RMSM_03820 [Rhodopirellula maiorica SM1]
MGANGGTPSIGQKFTVVVDEATMMPLEVCPMLLFNAFQLICSRFCRPPTKKPQSKDCGLR